MLEDIVKWDRSMFTLLNGWGTAQWDPFWLFITDKWSSIPLYVLLLVLCFYFFGWKRTLLILGVVAVMITVSDQLSNMFKYGFERLRPCYDPELESVIRLVKSSCGGKYGYFSAHASNSTAVAAFFGLLFMRHARILAWVLPIWALTVAYSRIYLGVHFPLDVLTGIVLGGSIGTLSFLGYQKLSTLIRTS